jgi:hypothetical protein
VLLFPGGQRLARAAAVRDDRGGGDVAAVADDVDIAAGVFGTGLAEGFAVVAVARQRGAQGDDQLGVGVDDDLEIGRVPVAKGAIAE